MSMCDTVKISWPTYCTESLSQKSQFAGLQPKRDSTCTRIKQPCALIVSLYKTIQCNSCTTVYADDPVLFASSLQGLQNLEPLDKHCQKWMLAENLKKTHYSLSKKAQMSEAQIPNYSRQHCPEQTMQYTYLGPIITASGGLAVNKLKEKCRRMENSGKLVKDQNTESVSIWRKHA